MKSIYRSFDMIVEKFFNASLIPCSPNNKNPTGMAALIRYLAGNPPGSGLVSPIAKEFIVKCVPSIKPTTHSGIKSSTLPVRLTHAFFFTVKF